MVTGDSNLLSNRERGACHPDMLMPPPRHFIHELHYSVTWSISSNAYIALPQNMDGRPLCILQLLLRIALQGHRKLKGDALHEEQHAAMGVLQNSALRWHGAHYHLLRTLARLVWSR